MSALGIVLQVIILVALTADTCHGKRILAVEFMGSKSHVLTYLPLLEELSRRGHEVTLVSPVKNVAKEGIREITTIDMSVFTKALNMTLYEMKEANKDLNPFPILKDLAPAHLGALYDRPDIKALMDEPFDLVILQPLFNDGALGFVHIITKKNKAPLILFSPTSAPSFMVGFIGGHHPPSFVPGVFTGFRDEMTFWERVQNFAFEIAIYCIYSYYYLPTMEQIYYDKLGNDLPSAKEILGSASLILANGHFSISRPKPNLPDVIDVGGLHSYPAKPLPKDLEDFIAKGKDGFIFFSLGTGLRGDAMPLNKQQMFINVFSKLKQQIVWKFESENLLNLPKNVKISKWLPQQDLLGHAQIKMFITHCGLGGIEESIYHGVPLIGIPIFGDQPLNAKESANHGFLLPLDWNHLTEEILLNGIKEVLQNPKYKESIQELSSVFKDQIDSPLNRAVWWTEYVIRTKGAPKLQSVARKLNVLQYHSIDVIALILFVIFLILYVIVKVTKFICSKFCRKNSKPKKTGTKSKSQ